MRGLNGIGAGGVGFVTLIGELMVREGREELLSSFEDNDLLKLAKFCFSSHWTYTTIIYRIIQLESAQARVEFR